jgi:hypothetical protein
MRWIMAALLFTSCVTAQKSSGDEALDNACVNLCEAQAEGSGCESVLSGTDCSQSCQGIVAAVSDECKDVAQNTWGCLANGEWECIEGSSPELIDGSCEELQISYLNCIERSDTAG